MPVGPMRLVLVLVALVMASPPVGAQAPTTIEGPIPGTAFVPPTIDPTQVGYVSEEYFISGTASAYTNVGPLGRDGMWTVAPASTAPYKTRILVRRPANPKKFKGTVFVEWNNVSGGVDASPDWTFGQVEIVRGGHAWVGVTAQFVGVEGGPGLLGVANLPLKEVDPARYGTLSHPGDSFSYDIYSQAGRAARSASGPLKDLKVKKVIAIGESQSAFRLTNYVNGIHPVAKVYDGYLIHSRGVISIGGLSQPPQANVPTPGDAVIRADIDVPVLTFETESDLTFLGYAGARQDDAKNFRLWEVAGTAHADSYQTVVGPTDLGDSSSVVEIVAPSSPVAGFIDCDFPINSGPQHFVLKAALSALDKWVRKGKAPRTAPRLAVDMGPPVRILTDANGNGLGGIRTPQVDVPIATFTGEQDGSILCRLFGTTTLFSDAQLAALYPTHKDFVSKYKKALKRAVKAGWILKPDAKLMKEWAVESSIGG